MNLLRTVRRPARLLLASLVVLVWCSAGIATREPVEPPMGLAEVKPDTPMPTFNLPGVNGEVFDSSKLQGKVVVVRFWATW
jgi:cytochrome oxidase Cu insertion factor (SCO1/SenC/PrrC family)